VVVGPPLLHSPSQVSRRQPEIKYINYDLHKKIYLKHFFFL